MLPVNSHFHLVIGVDIHIVLVPTPAGPVPTPLPHPFIGYIFSAMDYIPKLGAKTFVNSVPRGNSGSNGKLGTEEHLPMPPGTKIVKPPANNSFNYFGSLTVKAEGNLLSPSGYMVMSCSDMGIPMTLSTPPGNRKFFPPVPSLYTPLSATIPIPLGPPVLVGGPYVPDLMGMLKMLLFSYGFSAALKGLGTLINNLVFKQFDCTEGLSEWLCQKGMDPVDFVTGRVIYKITDFELSGPLPIKWERIWYSDSGYKGILGHGTHLCYDLTLITDYKESVIGVLLPDGRAKAFPLMLNTDESFYDRSEKLTLINKGDYYELIDHRKKLTYKFQQFNKNIYKPVKLTNLNGFSIIFNYDGAGKLIGLIDSVGRNIFLKYDNEGRLIEVNAKHKGDNRKLVEYGYNENNDLNKITDALGKATLIRYENHLMVAKTDRNGQTFYWEYDGKNKTAKCIHSWGDGGLLEGWIKYNKDYNEYTNSLNEKTTYYYDDKKLCTKIIDAAGNAKEFEYTEFMEMYRITDEEGNITGYTYDERGNFKSKNLPDNTALSYVYSKNDQLQLKMDASNQTTVYNYNDDKLLRSVIKSDGSVTAFNYNSKKLLSSIQNEQNQETKFLYDEDSNLSSVQTVKETITKWHYDEWGRCTQIINPENKSQYVKYDELNRAISIKKFDSNSVQLKYDAYEEITAAEDKHYKVKFTYNAFGSLLSREQNDTFVRFLYDTENRLTKIRNEFNEAYSFKRNAKGEIISEIGFDGITRQYYRDRAGKVLHTERPGNKWTKYEYDLAGRLIRSEHNDGTWTTYSYNKNGQITQACNENSILQIKRDAMGRVINETCGEHWVKSEYDKPGKRIKIKSSLGAEVNNDYSIDGTLQKTKATANKSKEWEASYKYSILGLETERNLPGGIQRIFEYDAVGNPVKEKISISNKETFSRKYSWDVNYRLTQMVDELTKGVVNYGHDEFGNLASAKYENNEMDYRMPDAAGNLYKTKEKKDRKYGAGGKLLESDAAFYKYDDEGNLILKKEKNGREWQYEWKGNGMLQKVIRPDNKTVQFEYDALGRRLSKTYNNNVTRWLWNGNVPLHEWQYQEKEKPKPVINEFGEILNDKLEPVANLITWIFDEGSFKPAAKIDGQNTYSIITDYLGTPVEMYDDTGQKTWQATYDIRGKIRKLEKGNLNDCPFRYQGQYEDVETGLSYNRFRYYASDEGIYISQDPVKLKGGFAFYNFVHDPNIFVDVFGLMISLDDALQQASDFMQPGVPQRLIEGPTGLQVIQVFTDANGDIITKRVGFDIDPSSAHVQQYGPHLNLQTQVNGEIQGGALTDPHTPIDPSTITPGDLCH